MGNAGNFKRDARLTLDAISGFGYADLLRMRLAPDLELSQAAAIDSALAGCALKGDVEFATSLLAQMPEKRAGARRLNQLMADDHEIADAMANIVAIALYRERCRVLNALTGTDLARGSD